MIYMLLGCRLPIRGEWLLLSSDHSFKWETRKRTKVGNEFGKRELNCP